LRWYLKNSGKRAVKFFSRVFPCGGGHRGKGERGDGNFIHPQGPLKNERGEKQELEESQDGQICENEGLNRSL